MLESDESNQIKLNMNYEEKSNNQTFCGAGNDIVAELEGNGGVGDEVCFVRYFCKRGQDLAGDGVGEETIV